MRGSPRHGTATVGFIIVLLKALLLSTQAAQGVHTDHLLVQLHQDAQDEAHQLATQHGFQSARKVGMLGEDCHALMALQALFCFVFCLQEKL